MPIALTSSPSEIRSISAEFESASPTEVLQWAFDQFGTQAAIGTSFQGAGLVTIHKAVAAGIPVPVFTIDTGLLFPETLELKASLERFFGIAIEALRARTQRAATGPGDRPGTLEQQSGFVLHAAQGRAASEKT